MKNMTLGKKLLTGGLLAVAIPIIIVGVVSVYQASKNTYKDKQDDMAIISESLAGSLETTMYEQLLVIKNISYSNSVIAAAEKMEREGEKNSRHEIALAEKELIKIKNAEGDRLSSVNIVGRNGIFFASSDRQTFKGTDISKREYFINALKGKPSAGSVVVSATTGRVVCTSAAPVYSSNGKDITGVVIIALELRFFSDISQEMKIGKGGYIFIVDKNGLYITHPAKEKILKESIFQTKGMEDASELIRQGKKGNREYTVEGIRRVASVAPVNITGWSVVSVVPVDELYAPARFTRNVIISVGIIFLLLASVFFYLFSRSLTRPMGEVVDAAQKIASGDLSLNISSPDRHDEIGRLIHAFNEMVRSLKEKIQVAERIAANDLAVDVMPSSERDALGNALATMVDTMRKQIQEIVEGVNILATSGNEIMASVTQFTSGAAETSTAVTETTTTVEEVKQTAEVSNQKARHVVELGQKTAEIAKLGLKSIEDTIAGISRIKEQMEAVADIVVRLSEQSQAIGEIITTVSDIAEQSNLLSVNASIEAAKAGEHGKGFAVVAQEIKSLADQSKQATALIRTILFDVQKAISSSVLATEQGNKAVEAGVKLSTQAGESIEALAESVTEAANAAIQIAASNQQQLAGMDQVVSAMENIRDASMETAGSAKQTERAARDLHNLGQKLQEMVSRYKI